MVARRRLVSVLLAAWVVGAVVAVGGCGGGSKADQGDEEPAESEQGEASRVGAVLDERAPRLDVRLEEADRLPERAEWSPPERPTSETLSEDRLGDIWEEGAAVPGGKPGATRASEESFSTTGPTWPDERRSLGPLQSERPPEGPANRGGPLRVVDKQPTGEVGKVGRLSIVFSKPMGPPGDDRALSESEVPVDLSPNVDGRWRWVGTRTLTFEPAAGRFPMATSYDVEVAGSDGSAQFSDLKPSEWSFQTAPVEPLVVAPRGGSHSLDPPMFMAFNQAVSREAIVEHVQVWGGGKVYRPRPIDRERVRRNPQLRSLVERAPEGHWIAFRVEGRLEPGTSYQIGLKQGAPSAEGPRTVKKGTFAQFSTFGRFEIEAVRCGWKEQCPPTSDWTLQFNHVVDPSTLDPDTIQIRPKLEGRQVEVRARRVVISGRVQPNETYEIRVDDTLRDRFGMALRRPVVSKLDVGSADPGVWTAAGETAVLDPGEKPTATVSSVGGETVRVRGYAVDPEDWSDFSAAREKWLSGGAVDWPGEEAFEREIDVLGDPGSSVTPTEVELGEALDGETGHVVMVAELTDLDEGGTNHGSDGGGGESKDALAPSDESKDALAPSDESKDALAPLKSRTAVWYQATDLGIDAFRSDRDAAVWVTSLESGEPVEGASATFLTGSAEATTDDSGVARLEVPERDGSEDGGRGGVLVVETRDDGALLPESAVGSRDRSAEESSNTEGRIRWHVVADRPAYRPGDRAELRGWFRRVAEGRGGPELEVVSEKATVAYRVEGPGGDPWGQGDATRTGDGGFHTSFSVPSDAELGSATVTWRLSGPARTWNHEQTLQVRQFRRATVDAEMRVSSGRHVSGEPVRLGLEVDREGRGMSGANVQWRVETSPTRYQPPGWEGFEFGWNPVWWRERRRAKRSSDALGTRTRADGTSAVTLASGPNTPAEPMRVEATAKVGVPGSRNVGERRSFVLHPAGVYAGIAPDARIYGAGETVDVKVLAADAEGEAVADRDIEVTVQRLTRERRNGRTVTTVAHRESCEVTSKTEPVSCEFDPDEGGEYRLVARVEDESGRSSETVTRVWVAGAPRSTPNGEASNRVEVVPERRRYRPGETAEMLVRAPIPSGRGLLVLQGAGEPRTRTFRIDQGTARVEVPIEEREMPRAEVRAVVHGFARRDVASEEDVETTGRPVQATGQVTLRVRRSTKRLGLEIDAEGEVEPGETVNVGVRATGADGESVSDGTVAVAVVDESLLEAVEHEYSDPLPLFYPAPSASRAFHLRELIQSGGYATLSERPEAASAAPAGSAGRVRKHSLRSRDGAGKYSLQLRGPTRQREQGWSRLCCRRQCSSSCWGLGSDPAARVPDRLTIYYEPELDLDDRGRGDIEVTMPDRRGEFRTVVVGSAGSGMFGRTSQTISTRRSVAMWSAQPRYLRVGDRVDWPVVVDNHGEETRRVEVAARSNGRVVLPSDRGKSFEVSAGERAEVTFDVEASSAGRATLEWVLQSENVRRRSEVDVEVSEPRSSESLRVHGRLEERDEAVSTRVQLPEDDGATGALEIEAGATARVALVDAFAALASPRFSASEWLASSILAAAVAESAGWAGRVATPSDERLKSWMATLEERQNEDGGFGRWGDEGTSSPATTVRVVHALARASRAGIEVPDELLERGGSYLRGTESNPSPSSGWSFESVLDMKAYGFWALELSGGSVPGRVRTLAKRRMEAELGPAAGGWLLSTMAHRGLGGDLRRKLVDELRERIVVEEGRGWVRNESESSESKARFVSNVATNAVVASGLIRAGVDREVVEPLIRELLDRRRAGRWSSAVDNALAIAAVTAYVQAHDRKREKGADSAGVRGWFGDRYLGRRSIGGDGMARWRIPVSKLLEWRTPGADVPIVLQNAGSGAPYFRVELSRSVRRGGAEGRHESGMAVERTFAPAGSPSTLQRRSDGTWVVEAGARVRVDLRVALHAERSRFALVDQLPAGLRPLHEVGGVPEGAGGREPWFDQRLFREEGVEVYADRLGPGTYQFSYIARTVFPGRYRAPPARGEDVADSSVSGRSTYDDFVVEPPGGR